MSEVEQGDGDIASSPARRRDRKIERAQQHAAEARAQTMGALNAAAIHTRLDASRGIWQAWAGDAPFESAEYAAEWSTEIGSIRRLRNRKAVMEHAHGGSYQLPVAQPAADTSRARSVDASLLRRYDARGSHASPGWSGAMKASLVLVLVVGAFGAGAAWFADRAASRVPRPLIPVEAFDHPQARMDDAYPDAGRASDAAVERRGAGREPASIRTIRTAP